MKKISVSIPFGKGHISAGMPEKNLRGVFESGVSSYKAEADGKELVKRAFDNPVNSPKLEDLAETVKDAVIIASDHTRPVPSKVIFPELLKRLRLKNPSIKITILIATGCHRETTIEELTGKFGAEIVKNEKIVIHDCRDDENMVSLGILPSGAELKINRVAAEASLLVSEGFIEPHFFAGFSGGRKSVLPGIASEKTVMGNHCAKFISSPYARAGILEGNPLHRDMVWAAEKAKLKFIINVIINAEKEVINAFAGHCTDAHYAGCNFLKDLCGIKVPESDIVISSNGGFPLDQNMYQAVKGMSAAEAVCRKNGVIIMVASCSDGHGGESFYDLLAKTPSPAELLAEIEKVPQDETVADQWEAQILARILKSFTVIMVCDKSASKIITDMHMKYAPSLEDALAEAFRIKGADASLAVIPDGVAVCAEKI